MASEKLLEAYVAWSENIFTLLGYYDLLGVRSPYFDWSKP